jgi:tRNA U55 pseudouridine synthase TruB
MALLRRTSVSVFNASDAVPLDALTKENFPKWVTSSSDAVAFLPSTELDDQQLADVLNGKKFECLLTFEQDQLVRLLRGDELLGLGRYADGFLQPEKVFPPVEE